MMAPIMAQRELYKEIVSIDMCQKLWMTRKYS